MSAFETQVEVVADVSGLPDHAFGPRGIVWWGTFGFMLLEGAGFLLAAGAYLYVATQSRSWPPAGDAAPSHLWGALFTVLTLASLLPNLWLDRMAKLKNEGAVRLGLVLMTLIGVIVLVVRGFEFAHLNVRWDHDAYGSLVWMLLFLHATHVITDLGDTAVIALWFFTHEPGDSQYSDVSDNAGYWTYVVVTWLPLYLLIYWAPRWL
jgi:cytochrome c oxidase subunit 3